MWHYMSQLKVLSKLHLHDLYSSIQKLRTTKITLYMECHYKNGKCIICVCMYVYIYIYIYTHTYIVYPGKDQPLLIWRERFAQHRWTLAAKESGLECACLNNNDFTILVSGGSGRGWVGMWTVWPSRSKWLSE